MHPRLLHPSHPERICWGCDRFCPADDLGCSNGSIRTPHPCELFGDDWLETATIDTPAAARASTATPAPAPAPADG